MDLDAQIAAEQEARKKGGIGLTDASQDEELYGSAVSMGEYVQELAEEEEAAEADTYSSRASGRAGNQAQRVIAEHKLEAEADGEAAMRSFQQAGSKLAHGRIAEREGEVSWPGLWPSLERPLFFAHSAHCGYSPSSTALSPSFSSSLSLSPPSLPSPAVCARAQGQDDPVS
jgi:hypothetical protein